MLPTIENATMLTSVNTEITSTPTTNRTPNISTTSLTTTKGTSTQIRSTTTEQTSKYIPVDNHGTNYDRNFGYNRKCSNENIPFQIYSEINTNLFTVHHYLELSNIKRVTVTYFSYLNKL